MPWTPEDYADVQSVEPLLRRFYATKVEKLITHPAMTVDLFKRAGKDEVNALMRQYPVELYGNPNIGRGNAEEGFREPGSPAYGALYFGPLHANIVGGLDGDALDNQKTLGKSASDIVAERMASDFEMFWEDLNRNIFHGNSGERGVVDVSSLAIAISGGISTVQFDSEFGVKHLNVGGTYQFYSSGTLKGSANGYVCVSKDPETMRARFRGDLTAGTLGGSALADGDIVVNKGTYNKDWDGLPEFLGNSGWYGGNNRDRDYPFRGIQVDGQDKNLSVGILERCDVRMRNVGDGKYNAKSRIDLTNPTQESALYALGWAQQVFLNNVTPSLGFTAIKYKDRTLYIDKDCSVKEWYQLDLTTIKHLMLREFGVFPSNRDGNGMQVVIDVATGIVKDKYYWVIYGKGNRACVASRRNLMLYDLGTTGLETGHVF